MRPRLKSGVPVPPKKQSPEWEILERMAVNDSFEVPIGKKRAVYKHAERAGIKITVRKQDGKIRVWRIA